MKTHQFEAIIVGAGGAGDKKPGYIDFFITNEIEFVFGNRILRIAGVYHSMYGFFLLIHFSSEKTPLAVYQLQLIGRIHELNAL